MSVRVCMCLYMQLEVISGIVHATYYVSVGTCFS